MSADPPPETGPPSAAAPVPRDVALDVLRAVAVLLVIGRHLGPPPEAWPAVGRAVFDGWRRGGWIGVDLFFVLSGYLVSGLLFQEWRRRRSISTGRFYLRRGFKIYPAFWLLILATALAAAVLGQRLAPRSVAAELLFVQNYWPGLWDHTWSLAVEEHFYFALPLLLLVLLRRARSPDDPFAPIPWIFAGLAALLLVLRSANAALRPFADFTHLYPTHLRIDALGLGVIVAYARHFRARAFEETLAPKRLALALSGVALMAPAFLVPLGDGVLLHSIGLSAIDLGAASLLAGLLLGRGRWRATRTARTVAYVGSHSYSIYLWHLPVRLLALPGIEALAGTELPFGVRVAVCVPGSIFFGIAMANAVELPLLRVRDRWLPSRSQPVGGDACPAPAPTPSSPSSATRAPTP